MHAKSKISGMISKGFKAAKCKTSLKLATSRIKLIKNKKEAQLKQMKQELAQLLATGQDQTALIRVEHVIREEKTISAYDLIEVYCELIAARLPIIESQKSCPIDLKEAISSVIFASPRSADIPELVEVRKHLTAKYGKEFITAALEVRPDCGVSRLIVEKLSARAPDVGMKIKALTEVAKEHNIKWEPKAFEEKTQHVTHDLLDGPTSFTSAGNLRIESLGLKSSSVYTHDNYPTKLPEDNAPTKINSDMFSYVKLEGPTTSIPPRASEKLSKGEEAKYKYPKEENAILNSSNWSLKFKDATAAAQAAADSAERASIAARAAAKFASRGRTSRQHTTDSYEPSISATKDEGSESSRSSKSENAIVVETSTDVEDEQRRSMQVMQQKMQNVQRDDKIQPVANTGNVTPESSSSSIMNVMSKVIQKEDDAKPYDDNHKNSEDSKFSARSSGDEAEEDDTVILLNPYASHNESASSYSSDFNDHTWDDHDSNIKVSSSDVVFDRYDSDAENHSIFETYSNEKLSGSSMVQNRKFYSFSASRGFQGPDEHNSGSVFTENSSQLHPVTGNYHLDYAETITKPNLLSLTDDYLQPTYDSDGHSSDSEDDIEKLERTEGTKSKKLTENISGEESSLSIPGVGSASMNENKEVEDTLSSLPTVSDVIETNIEVEPTLPEKTWRRPGLSVRNSQQLPKKSTSTINLAESASEITEKETVTSDESGGLGFGRLSGGLKNKGYTRPPYVRNTITIDSSEKEVVSNVTTEERSEKKSMEDSRVKADRSKPRALEDVYSDNAEEKDLHYSLENISAGESSPILRGQTKAVSIVADERVITQYSKTSRDKIHIQQRQRNEQKDTMSTSSLTNFDEVSYEQQNYKVEFGNRGDDVSPLRNQDRDASPSENFDVSNQSKTSSSDVTERELYGQKPNIKKDSSSRMPRNSILDDSDQEVLGPHINIRRKGNSEMKFSRRTKVLSSDAEGDASSRTTGMPAGGTPFTKENKYSQEAIDPFPSRTKLNMGLDDKPSSKPHLPYLSAEEPKMKNSDIESSTVRGSHKSSSQYELRESSVAENDGSTNASGGQTSHESSLRSASHVHPKLPDYDTLAAHFQSLRSNV